jgi:nicotinamidase/pyrazinamidase
MSEKVRITESDLLLIVDVQNDFCPGGALAVPHGDEVVQPINRICGAFSHAALTQDWHAEGHVSFASSHKGANPFETIMLPYGEQILWPDHCVRGTGGADFPKELDTVRSEVTIRKGFHRDVDSYSAFRENDRKTPTGLAGYMRTRGFRRLFLAGLATDFCVLHSALDARAEEFEVFVIEDAVRGIDVAGSINRAWRAMADAGVRQIRELELMR